MTDLSTSMITDLSWGFNGNVLMASTLQGDIFYMHFHPGKLGTKMQSQDIKTLLTQTYSADVMKNFFNNRKITIQKRVTHKA